MSSRVETGWGTVTGGQVEVDSEPGGPTTYVRLFTLEQFGKSSALDMGPGVGHGQKEDVG